MEGTTRKVAVIGVGAMGSVYAALMAEAGHQVWAVDCWAEHVAAINRDGLRVEGASGNRTVRGLRAVAHVAELDPCDLYIVATKASGVAQVARDLAHCLPPTAQVLAIQNGLGAGERICAHLPRGQVLLGVADGFGAAMRGPAHVHHAAMKLIRLGELDGGLTPRLQTLERFWQDCGFQARAFADLHQLIWEKFLCNVALSAPCTLFDCTVGELMDNPRARAVSFGCVMEAFRCGCAEGINFSFEDPLAYVRDFAARLRESSPSMRLDHQQRRRSEIDAINGMVPVLGARLGIETPYNTTLSALVRAREEKF